MKLPSFGNGKGYRQQPVQSSLDLEDILLFKTRFLTHVFWCRFLLVQIPACCMLKTQDQHFPGGHEMAEALKWSNPPPQSWTDQTPALLLTLLLQGRLRVGRDCFGDGVVAAQPSGWREIPGSTIPPYGPPPRPHRSMPGRGVIAPHAAPAGLSLQKCC